MGECWSGDRHGIEVDGELVRAGLATLVGGGEGFELLDFADGVLELMFGEGELVIVEMIEAEFEVGPDHFFDEVGGGHGLMAGAPRARVLSLLRHMVISGELGSGYSSPWVLNHSSSHQASTVKRSRRVWTYLALAASPTPMGVAAKRPDSRRLRTC